MPLKDAYAVTRVFPRHGRKMFGLELVKYRAERSVSVGHFPIGWVLTFYDFSDSFLSYPSRLAHGHRIHFRDGQFPDTLARVRPIIKNVGLASGRAHAYPKPRNPVVPHVVFGLAGYETLNHFIS